MPTEEPTWAVGLHKKHGGVYGRVTGWRLAGNGVKPVINHERIPAGIRFLDVFRGTELDAAKVAAMRELAEVADRCKTPEALADLKKMADWVANWEPGDPGLSLGSGDGG